MLYMTDEEKTTMKFLLGFTAIFTAVTGFLMLMIPLDHSQETKEDQKDEREETHQETRKPKPKLIVDLSKC